MPGTTLGANSPKRAAQIRAKENPAAGLTAEQIVESFNLNDLKTLCKQLGILMPKTQTKKTLAALIVEAS